MRRFFSLLLLVVCAQGSALGLGVYGIFGLAGQSAESPNRYSGGWNFGEGAFARFTLAPGMKLDLGLQLHRRTYRVNDLADVGYGTVEPNAILRLNALPWLNFGLGAAGAILTSKKIDPAVAAAAPAFADFDAQLLATAGAEWQIVPTIAAFVEARGSFGFVDIDQGASSLRTRGLGFATGAVFEL